MHIFKEIAPLRAHLNALRAAPDSVGFVPTMGALHEGHMSLIRASQKNNSITVCSIFVNPTQFNSEEDLAKYPRPMEQDLALLEKESCDIAFCPQSREMYDDGRAISITFPGLDDILEGKFRPGHFSGVAQVVAKLLNIVQPDRAYFGQKDLQQAAIVSSLVKSLKMNVQLCVFPTVREPDGLAMSSRNQRLSPSERRRAVVLYNSLCKSREALLAGTSIKAITEHVRGACAQQDVRLEYLAVVDHKTFTLLDRVSDPGGVFVLIAANVGSVRLIDNLPLEP